jgi:general secretion pathway protein H
MSRSNHPASGFTLIEMLVVVAIAAILVSVASLSIGSVARHDLSDEATRLSLAFEAAEDEAQLRDHPIAWQPVDGGYQFSVRQGGAWHLLRDDLLAPHVWRGVTQVNVALRGVRDTPPYLLFGADAQNWPSTVTLTGPDGHAEVTNAGNGRYDVH